MLAARIEGFHLIGFGVCGALCVTTAVDYEIIYYVNVILQVVAREAERPIRGRNGFTPSFGSTRSGHA